MNLARLARNLWLDLRYGGWLGGVAPTRFADRGANDTANTDYAALPAIFPPGEIAPGETLADIGCGKGRVLNWWLSRYGATVRIVGVELDPDIAARTRRRLARHRNVAIEAGDVVELVGRLDADVLYLFNPFGAEVMARLETAAAEATASGRPLRLYYYHPRHLDVWEAGPWRIERRPMPEGFHALAVITPRSATGTEP